MIKADNAVAVIIPCGGWHSELVNDAVNSCLLANPQPDEIIVIDDDSDPPVELENAEAVILHVFYTRQNRSRARNYAAMLTDCPWLYFLDADDMLEPTAIADFQAIVRKRNLDLIFADYDYIAPNGERRRVKKPPPSRHQIRRGIRYRNHWNIGMFVRRERFKKIGGFDENMEVGEYWDFFLRYTVNPAVEIYKHDRPFFIARQSSSVLSDAGQMMHYASLKIQAMIRGNYYKPWIRI